MTSRWRLITDTDVREGRLCDACGEPATWVNADDHIGYGARAFYGWACDSCHAAARKCVACVFGKSYVEGAGGVAIDLLITASAGVAVGLALGLELARRTEATRERTLEAMCPDHRALLEESTRTIGVDGEA